MTVVFMDSFEQKKNYKIYKNWLIFMAFKKLFSKIFFK